MSCFQSSLASHHDLVFLAPSDTSMTALFQNTWRSNDVYTRLLSEMQRLRGRIYLKDGALSPSHLSEDGRHIAALDEKSWHLLILNHAGRVLGCLRFYRLPPLSRFSSINFRRGTVFRSRLWGRNVRNALQSEMVSARYAKAAFIELGGWALAEELRNTTEALRSVIAAYAWSEFLGGALCITTATQRNGSASILRRVGGRALGWDGAEFPPYFDENYGCQMELLRFDSSCPNPKYRHIIDDLKLNLPKIPVISRKPLGLLQKVAAHIPRPSQAPLWAEELIHNFN
ncbi:MAG: hypothetical protein M3Z09_02925 [Acidobacteriota bacterium]|nr:hypothetical protein [Acidobacteriota bacterium]